MVLIPSTSYDPTSPAGSQAISLGDDAIRLLKVQIQEVINVDHDFPSSGQASDNGQHKQVTLQNGTTISAGLADTGIIHSKDVSAKAELFYMDEDNNDVQITTGGKIRTLSLKASAVADMANLLELIYPIGYVVTLGVSTNPGTLFGVGTWTAIAGKVIVGIDAGQTEFDALDETGGEKTHTLTTPEIPAHTHSYTTYSTLHQRGDISSTDVPTTPDSSGTTGSTGGGGAHNNLQPYIVKYVWQRTA